MIYLFRKEFRVGARELLTGMEQWEIDILLEQWNHEQKVKAQRGR